MRDARLRSILSLVLMFSNQRFWISRIVCDLLAITLAPKGPDEVRGFGEEAEEAEMRSCSEGVVVVWG